MKSETNLVCNPCVIYLASEKVTIISRDKKNNAWAVWGPPELWGPRPGPSEPIG